MSEIQKLLWLDQCPTDERRSNGGEPERFWNAAKTWSCVDLVPEIATVLDDHGLKPIDPPVVIGTTHKLDYEDLPIPEDYVDNDDPDYWQGQPGGNPPTS